VIRETGRVIAIKSGELWVETIQQSTCESCAAEKGCGQRLIAKATGKTTAIKVLPGRYDIETVQMNDEVVIGIPEHVIVTGTLLTYFLPLLTMVLGVILLDKLLSNDAATAIGAVSGLLLGAVLVRIHSYLHRDDLDVHPILLEQVDIMPVQIHA